MTRPDPPPPPRPPAPGPEAKTDAAAEPAAAEGSETLAIGFRVERVDRVAAGRLVALATVLIDVEGVEFRIQGIRVMTTSTGLLTVEAPRFRSPGGEWVPAVTLPDALKSAIANEILGEVERKK